MGQTSDQVPRQPSDRDPVLLDWGYKLAKAKTKKAVH